MGHTKSNTSVFSSLGLAIVGTTCCALPILLVTLGAGAAMASLVSALPWIAVVSKYKVVVFALTTLVLSYAWWQVRRVTQCDIADAKRLRWQRGVLWFSTIIFALSVFAAYAGLPLARWLDSL